VFVLEMGEPVRIVDLARNMIRLAGYEPDEDIAIEFTGPRPGEQLDERLLAEGEHAEPTSAPRIVRAVPEEPIDPETVEETMRGLRKLTESGDESGLAERIVALIGEAAPGGAGAGVAESR
jgi:O-antigen biosynthesis protein WbqV